MEKGKGDSKYCKSKAQLKYKKYTTNKNRQQNMKNIIKEIYRHRQYVQYEMQ